MRQDHDHAGSRIPEDVMRSAHAVQLPSIAFKPAAYLAT